VIASMTPGIPPVVTWANAELHINGNVEVDGPGCTTCHGDPATGAVSPPKGTSGETDTTQPAVGAHQIHLAASSWRRTGQCTDCHVMPPGTSHPNGVVEFGWDGPSAMNGASPAYVASTNTCSSVYCHGTTLAGPVAGGTVNRTPKWTVVDGTFSACGTTCHTLPPGGSHPPSSNCQACHGSAITAIDLANPSAAMWNDASLHVNGTVDF
jgi:predicted CxxxxCH...CXXCH cytochrome family protein